MSNVSAKSQVN